MLPRSHPDGIHIAFDDHRLVNNAGLLLPTTLARHLGLPQLVQECLDLGNAQGRANTDDKIVTLVASALAGGDCIDDADTLRAGGTEQVLGCVVKAPSTLGTFLRSFRWGHVRQLDRVSRELLARAWAAGAGPGDTPLTIDLDSTICETYGLAKEGARHHSYTGQRGYHPLLAIAAGTGDTYSRVPVHHGHRQAGTAGADPSPGSPVAGGPSVAAERCLQRVSSATGGGRASAGAAGPAGHPTVPLLRTSQDEVPAVPGDRGGQPDPGVGQHRAFGQCRWRRRRAPRHTR